MNDSILWRNFHCLLPKETKRLWIAFLFRIIHTYNTYTRHRGSHTFFHVRVRKIRTAHFRIWLKGFFQPFQLRHKSPDRSVSNKGEFFGGSSFFLICATASSIFPPSLFFIHVKTLSTDMPRLHIRFYNRKRVSFVQNTARRSPLRFYCVPIINGMKYERTELEVTKCRVEFKFIHAMCAFFFLLFRASFESHPFSFSCESKIVYVHIFFVFQLIYEKYARYKRVHSFRSFWNLFRYVCVYVPTSKSVILNVRAFCNLITLHSTTLTENAENKSRKWIFYIVKKLSF